MDCKQSLTCPMSHIWQCGLNKLHWILICITLKDPPHSYLILWTMVIGPFLYIRSSFQSNVVWRHNFYMIFTTFKSSVFPLARSTLFTYLWIFLIHYNISNKGLICATYNTLVIELASLWVLLFVYNKPGCGQPQLTQTWSILLGEKLSWFPNKMSD